MENTNIQTEKSALLTAPHGFSTRLGGVSSGIYSSLNLGVNWDDSDENVLENWQRFLSSCNIPMQDIVFGKQVHGNNVHVASEGDRRPFHEIPLPILADGYVTAEPGLPIAVTTADCVPLLLEDPVHRVIGAVHCGWRPTVADIESEAIKKMISLGAVPSDIHAALGPAIDQCCFEVGPEVIDAVNNLLGGPCSEFYNKKVSAGTSSSEEKYMLDLRGVVIKRLLQLGLRPENIEKVGTCTMCHPDKYFSHRYSKGLRGSMFSVIMLPPCD